MPEAQLQAHRGGARRSGFQSRPLPPELQLLLSKDDASTSSQGDEHHKRGAVADAAGSDDVGAVLDDGRACHQGQSGVRHKGGAASRQRV
eukprot:1147546-Pelagomonas_calceolata.AAC.5